MARTRAFDSNTDRYDDWFARHELVYRSELTAIRSLVPQHRNGLEIGVGTGRFAAELGIRYGVDPSRSMVLRARERGVQVVAGTAEALPFADRAFDLCIVVTTICFVDDAAAMANEAYRVLEPGGTLVLGLIDRDSSIGRHYLAHKEGSVFYREATFYSAMDVERLLENTGFMSAHWMQTLFNSPSDAEVESPTRPGFGNGSFVAVCAGRPQAVSPSD